MRRGQAGFTLVELLVAFVLLGLLLTVAGGGLRDLSRGYRGGMERTWRQQDISLAGDILRRQAMLALAPVSGPRPTPPAFIGGRERMQFTILDPAAPGRGGMTQVGFVVERPSDGTVRLIYWQGREGGAIERRLLVEGPVDIAFAYRAADAGPEEWQEIWPAGRARPALARMSVSAAGRPLAAQVVRFPADADLSCLFAGSVPRLGRGPGCRYRLPAGGGAGGDDGIDRDNEAAEGPA